MPESTKVNINISD